jgi:hypothetical protein
MENREPTVKFPDSHTGTSRQVRFQSEGVSVTGMRKEWMGAYNEQIDALNRQLMPLTSAHPLGSDSELSGTLEDKQAWFLF